MTSIGNALDILRQQEMHPGQTGLCGPGIYFAPDPSMVRRKARGQGVTLCATVDLGNVMQADRSRCQAGEDWAGILNRGGFDSVCCMGCPSGPEYVVYESHRVRNIELYSSEPHRFTGVLNVSADGSCGTGQSFTNYRVTIVRFYQRPSSRYPILLGDNYSQQLGWVDASTLTPE
jgi:hypothetical protein